MTRYWLPILARYWLAWKTGVDTGSRYWLPILAGSALSLSILACSSPGWVKAPEPSPVPTVAPTLEPVSDPAPETIRETVSALQSLNVRAEPSERSTSLAVLYHGAGVILTRNCSPGWAEIRFRGRLAWVKARYITGDLCEEEK